MIYLDNASTTKPKFFTSDLDDSWMNHNAQYTYSLKHTITACREDIKKAIGATGGKIIFCRCASEAMDIISNEFKRLACFVKEHDCVWDNCFYQDFEWRNIPAADGYVCQLVNQLTGEYDLEIWKKGNFAHSNNQYFFCDATAAIGKVEIPARIDEWCDGLFFSCHKIHGPHIGVLWICDRLCGEWDLTKDERNNHDFLHGTLDAGAVIAATKAIICATSDIKDLEGYYDTLLNRLVSGLIKAGIDHELVGDKNNHMADYTSAINTIVLPGLNADSLQLWLASRNVYVGLGASACSDRHDYRVLCSGYDLSKPQAESAIRVSFCEDNTVEEIDRLVELIKEYKNIFN